MWIVATVLDAQNKTFFFFCPVLHLDFTGGYVGPHLSQLTKHTFKTGYFDT